LNIVQISAIPLFLIKIVLSALDDHFELRQENRDTCLEYQQCIKKLPKHLEGDGFSCLVSESEKTWGTEEPGS
jgi:hypothetical protein